MPRLALLIVLSVSVLCGSLQAFAEELKHEARVMARMGNHPNVVQFIGATTTDVALRDTPTGNNPIYTGQSQSGENPLYSIAGEPGTPPAVQLVTFELDNSGLNPTPAGNGVVHRDIAARNFLVSTNQGDYESAPGAFLPLGHDGPPDLRTNVGPVRWMAPESLRLHRNGATDPNDWIEIAEGSFIEVSYVPEPSSLALIALGMAGVMRRGVRACGR